MMFNLEITFITTYIFLMVMIVMPIVLMDFNNTKSLSQFCAESDGFEGY